MPRGVGTGRRPVTRCAMTGVGNPLSESGPSASDSTRGRTRRSVSALTTIPEGGRLEPRREIGHLTRDHELPRGLGHRHGLAGGDADAQLEASAVLLLEHGVQLDEAFPHGDGRPHRPLRVVLVDLRHAKDGHDRVARVLLHDAAEGADLLRHLLEERGQQRAELLGILPHRELGRADEVGEEHRDQLALFRWWHRAPVTREYGFLFTRTQLSYANLPSATG